MFKPTNWADMTSDEKIDHLFNEFAVLHGQVVRAIQEINRKLEIPSAEINTDISYIDGTPKPSGPE